MGVRKRTCPADSEKVRGSGSPQNLGAGAGGREKKTTHAVATEKDLRQLPSVVMLTEHYEMLRAYVLAQNGSSGVRLGQGALMTRGMAAWMQVAVELIPSVRSCRCPRGKQAAYRSLCRMK